MSHRKQPLIALTSLLLILSAIITCGCMTHDLYCKYTDEGEAVINPEFEGILKENSFRACVFTWILQPEYLPDQTVGEIFP